MKFIYKFFIGFYTFMYKLTGGRIGSEMNGFKVLLLTSKGRKSGKVYTTPVGYFERDGGYVIVASNGGRPKHPDWYYNLKANPAAQVQVKAKILPVQTEMVTGETRAAYWKWIVEIAPQFGGYETSAREIPLFMLKPV